MVTFLLASKKNLQISWNYNPLKILFEKILVF